MKNCSMPDFPMALPFSIAQSVPVSTTVQCSMGTNSPKPQLGILMAVQLGHPPSMYIYVRDKTPVFTPSFVVTKP